MGPSHGNCRARGQGCAVEGGCGTALVQDLLESPGYDPDGRFIVPRSCLLDNLPTALCWATVRGHTEVVEDTEVVKVLLAHGAELSPAPGRHGLQKPLFEAMKRGPETQYYLAPAQILIIQNGPIGCHIPR